MPRPYRWERTLRRVAFAALCASVLTAAFSPPAAAQEKSPLEPVCPPGESLVQDTLTRFLVLRPGPSSRGSAAEQRERAAIAYQYALAIKDHFAKPVAWAPPPMVGAYIGKAGDRTHGLWHGSVALVVTGNGTLKSSFFQLLPLAESFAAAVAAAVDSAARANAFAAMPHAWEVDTVVVDLDAVEKPEPDEIALARVRFASFGLSEPVKLLKKPKLALPAGLFDTSASLRSSQLFQYVVGTDGRVIATTIWGIGAPVAALLASGTAALLATEFKPARAGRCTVASLVQQRASWKWWLGAREPKDPWAPPTPWYSRPPEQRN